MYYARDTPYDFIGVPYIWKELSWRHEWVSLSFARVPLGLHWVYICSEGAPLRINFHDVRDFCKVFQWVPSGCRSVSVYFILYGVHTFCQGVPCEAINFTYSIQGVLLEISEDFQNIFCNRHPLGFHQIPSGISLATPIILQWALPRINFVVPKHFARVPLLTISLNFLSSWKKRWSLRYQWISIYFAEGYPRIS
jgi:hypothetical protein